MKIDYFCFHIGYIENLLNHFRLIVNKKFARAKNTNQT